jgi:hypothetical protein
MEDYEFVDRDIEYFIDDNERLFIEVDADRGIWAEIHKKDVEYMAKRFGII